MSRICSFVNSEKDLLNFRLVNRLFHREATKRQRSLQKPINFLLEFKIKPFLRCVHTRFDPANNPFPFVAFRLNLDISFEGLQDFLTRTGEHMRHLEICKLPNNRLTFGPNSNPAKVKQKLRMIFSSAPNLEHFQLSTLCSVHLEPDDIAALPASFPRLRSIHIDNTCPTSSRSPTSVPLLSHLITRTQVLDCVHVSSIKESVHNEQINALRLILLHHGNHLPVISLNCSQILPGSLPYLRDLTGMGLSLRNFPVELTALVNHSLRTLDFRARSIQDAVTWLGTQSATVTSLRVDISQLHIPLSFQVPPLALLEELEIHALPSILTCALQPLTPPNPFPALRKLTLSNFNDGFGIFENCSLLSVQELHIKGHTPVLTGHWHTILPNLTTINFEICTHCEEHERDGRNLGFLLRHFPRITGLELNLGNTDMWDVLTGRALRVILRLPSYNLNYNEGIERSVVGEPDTPVDGVYETASLRNLRGQEFLKKDTFSYH